MSDPTIPSDSGDQIVKTPHTLRNIAIGIAAIVLAGVVVLVVLILLGPVSGSVFSNITPGI